MCLLFWWTVSFCYLCNTQLFLRMEIKISPDECLDFQKRYAEQAVKIVALESEVAMLKKDCDYWKQRALRLEAEAVAKRSENTPVQERYIIIPVKAIASILGKIHNVTISAIVAFLMQKMLPKDAFEDSKAIADAVPMPSLPNISLTAEGDIKIEGNLNDIHDNDKVNI